jgi:iron complex transport system permease protein
MKSANSLSMSARLSPPESNLKTSNYKIVIFRKVIICVCLLILVLLSFVVDISTGAAHLSLTDVVNALFNPHSVAAQTNIIVNVIRLPIAVMAILVGSSLAVAGMEMQTILNNPLASPYTLGISSAATFGSSVSLVCGVTALPMIFQNIATPVFAFFFSLASSLLIFTIGKYRKGRSIIILSGIAVNFMFTAFNSILTFFVNDEMLRTITNWTQGNILGATWQQDLIVFVVVLIITPFLFKDSWKLTALCMGDATAKSLGVQVERLRIKVLVLTSVITAIAVRFVGTIGFIGLVAPYVAKKLVGAEQRFFIPASLLTGALMLSVSSTLSKTAFPGSQIPLGIITSIIGIPFLLVLILQKGR